jgi:hypothetical protein
MSLDNLKYIKGNIFEVAEPTGGRIFTTMSLENMWEDKINKHMKAIAPDYFQEVKEWKHKSNIGRLTGYGGFLYSTIVCSKELNSRTEINTMTAVALYKFIWDYFRTAKVTIYSTRFNEEWGVHWVETEIVLRSILKMFPSVTWIVVDPKKGGDEI